MPLKKYTGVNKKSYKLKSYNNSSLSSSNTSNNKKTKKTKNIRLEKYLKDIIEEFFPKSKVNYYTFSFKNNKDKYINFYIYDNKYKEGDFIEDFSCISLSFNHKKKF